MTHPPLKVKAPFLLTQMNHMSQPTWICVWSRRGRQWVVSQDLLLDATGKCPPRDCNVRSNIGREPQGGNDGIRLRNSH